MQDKFSMLVLYDVSNNSKLTNAIKIKVANFKNYNAVCNIFVFKLN